MLLVGLPAFAISIHALREEGDFLSISYDITIM